MSEQKDSLQEDIKQLVIARLKDIPSDKKISIGSEGSFEISELISRVKEGDEIGKKVIDVQMSYLQSLKTGVLLDE